MHTILNLDAQIFVLFILRQGIIERKSTGSSCVFCIFLENTKAVMVQNCSVGSLWAICTLTLHNLNT